MVKNFILTGLTLVIFSACENALIGPEPENTAFGNYDVLWETIDRKYGVFPAKNLDWDSLYIYYRNQISSSTTQQDLWNICCQLLYHLDDGHVTLFNKNYTNWCSAQNPDEEKKLGFSINLITDEYLVDTRITGEGYITYGKIKDGNLGYIYISSFNSAANGRDWAADIDGVIEDLSGTDALIIDLRNNGGGFIVNVNRIASVFIDHEITYFYSRKKTGPGHYDFGDPIAKTISPRAESPRCLKDNAVLTNRFSASGSEAFSQIFKFLNYSTQIGDTTNGSLGEVVHVAQLPNGWTMNYTGTLTTTPDGNCPEGVGIPPDIFIDNTKEDIDQGTDKVLEYAIDHLSEK